jgi:tyrosyl-tRNA synthetase
MRFSKRDLKNADLPAFSLAEQPDLTAVTVVSDVYRKVFQSEKSHSEISRLIKQGSVEVDGIKIRDPKAKITLHPGQILRLDRKRAVRIN